VAGTIRLTSDLNIKNPYITIAGQTAPSPGITIRGAGIAVWDTNDVLIQHIRVRVGDLSDNADTDRDGIAILASSRDVYNVVIDHVSASWGTDEQLSTWADPNTGVKIYDVTVRNSLFSEGLLNSIHSKGVHSMGLMIGPGTSRVTLVNNVFGFNAARNPLIRDDCTDVMVINNLIYRTRGMRTDQIDFGSRGSRNIAMRGSVVGNSFLQTPGMNAINTISIAPDAPSSVQLYVADNLGPNYSATNPWAAVNTGGRTVSSVSAATPPIWSAGLVAMDASKVESYTLEYAGARPLNRDAVDTRVVENIRARRGDIIDSQSQVGEWPTLASSQRASVLPANPNVTNPSGYTNLELWLQALAKELEGL
jgi:pectate lyase